MTRNEKGQFTKGASGNPKGKPVGTPCMAREWLDKFIEGDREDAIIDWKALTAWQRWNVRTKFLEYQIPKLRAESVDLNVDFDKLTEEQLDYIAYTVNEGSKKYDHDK